MNHTNLPWRFRMLGSEGGRIYPDYGDIRERGKFIAVVNGRSVQEDQANGDFIVKAANAHNGLVEALESVKAEYEDSFGLSLTENYQSKRDQRRQAQLQGIVNALTNAKGGQP